MTLGSYGFPDNGTEMIGRECETGDGTAKAVILKGCDSQGRAKQLAMTVYGGWAELWVTASRGTNPDSAKSLIVCAKGAWQKRYGCRPGLLISQVITKESHEDFTPDELFPIAAVAYTDPDCLGIYGPVTITLKSGEKRVIDFEGIEGQLLL